MAICLRRYSADGVLEDTVKEISPVLERNYCAPGTIRAACTHYCSRQFATSAGHVSRQSFRARCHGTQYSLQEFRLCTSLRKPETYPKLLSRRSGRDRTSDAGCGKSGKNYHPSHDSLIPFIWTPRWSWLQPVKAFRSESLSLRGDGFFGRYVLKISCLDAAFNPWLI